jgi:hypothetical protein
MELDYAFLAEKASRLDDGKLVVFGGDIDGIATARLPAPFQPTLVAKMTLEEGESRNGHVFSLECTSPSGNRVVIVKDQSLDPPPSVEGMRSSCGLIATIGIGLKSRGIYRLHLIVDGKELKSLPVMVECLDSSQSELEAASDENTIAHSDDGR